MIDIYLSVNNGAEVLEIPVIPKEVKVDNGQNTETFETASGTVFALLTSFGLKTISWESFFPSKDYDFVRGTRLASVFDYESIISKWQNARLPARLVIHFDGEKSINMAVKCVIKSYSIDPSGDMNYELECVKIPGELIEEDLTMAQYEELLQKIEELETKVDEYHKRYERFEKDDFPTWAYEAANLLYTHGALQGGESGLDLSHDMLRMLTLNHRAQAYRNIFVYNYVDANMQSYEPYMRWLVTKGYLKGDENGTLNLTEDMMRVLAIVVRMIVDKPLED